MSMTMNTFHALVRREWLQYRFGWAMLAGVPLALALPLLTFGQVQFGDEAAVSVVDTMPAFITVVSLLGTVAVLLVILWGASIIQVSGLARRDHADRSVEFWLSLPVGHVPSLAVPLLVHLVLVPLAAVAIGVAGGAVMSLVLVSRLEGVGAWFGLPWGALLGAVLAGMARLAVGIPLATLWLLPLLMLTVLAGAWFKRWAVPVLAAAFGLGELVLKTQFGTELLAAWTGQLFEQAGRSLINTGASYLVVDGPSAVLDGLRMAPSWAVHDIGAAIALLASPTFAIGLLISAACFGALVAWRRR
jgi:ABC-2 type transport system permease protein